MEWVGTNRCTGIKSALLLNKLYIRFIHASAQASGGKGESQLPHEAQELLQQR